MNIRRTLFFWFTLLNIAAGTQLITAQSSFSFMPEGQVNLLADTEGSAYLYIGGPTLKLFEKETHSLGLEYVPSLRFRPSAAEGRKVVTLTGAGLFMVHKPSRIKYNLVSYYDAPLREWTLAFGIGYVFSKKLKPCPDL